MRTGATQATDQAIEDLRLRATSIMGSDDRASLPASLLEVRDELGALRSKLVRRLRPIGGARGAAVVRGVLDRIARIDVVLGVMAACYLEAVGVTWDEADEEAVG